MGTRAYIRYRGKPLAVTHWDGDPEVLGVDIYNSDRTLRGVLRACSTHSIDFIDARYKPSKPIVTSTNTTLFYSNDVQARKIIFDLTGEKTKKDEYSTAFESNGIDYKLTKVIKNLPNDSWNEWEYDVYSYGVFVRPNEPSVPLSPLGKYVSSIPYPKKKIKKVLLPKGQTVLVSKHKKKTSKGKITVEKYKRSKPSQTGKRKSISADRKRKAKLPGKRKSKSGKTYTETRRNRSDRKGSRL